jgi:Mg-chelatase subunit ChlD
MQRQPPRSLLMLLAAPLLLAACSATAHAPLPGPAWPEPQPQPQPQPLPWPQQPVVRMTPDFQAPSAAHCARPVATREVPGFSAGQASRREAFARGEGKAAAADAAAPAAPAAPRAAAPAFALPQSAPQQPPLPPSQLQAVTAGVVDDNADFTSYLAFRDRMRVDHRPRDVRERYLLEVRDARGRGISDAEVAVQAASGYATWARTDAGGRVWLHPNAFDPAYSPSYDIAVRKGGRTAYAQLARGQRSSVEVRLDAEAAPPRARLDLVFLIDATGSMGDEIDKLKASLRSIVADVARLPSRPDLCLGLVAYRDRGDAFVLRSHDFTHDVGGFLRDALVPLRAAGGGDYPEAMNEALHETVHAMTWRGDGATRMVILLADAPPHLDYGAPHYDDAMLAALGKGIKVFSVGASGLDRQGEFIQRQIAQYTGGKFVFLTYAQAHDPRSGPGRETVHDVKNYSVDTLDRLIVRLVTEELGKLANSL